MRSYATFFFEIYLGDNDKSFKGYGFSKKMAEKFGFNYLYRNIAIYN